MHEAQEFVKERDKIAQDVVLRKCAVLSFIELFDDALELANERLQKMPFFDNGLSHRKSWAAFISADDEKRREMTNSASVEGLEWATLVQYSPFSLDIRWRNHLDLIRSREAR